MNLTRYEQETIINFNEAEGSASIYTHNPALKRKLKQLSVERPAECCLEKVSRGGLAEEYSIPKSWVKVNPTRILTEAQLAQRRAASKNTRFVKKDGGARQGMDHATTETGNYISQAQDGEKEA